MKPRTVDEYIDSFPEDQKAKLAELRKIVKTILPDTHEDLKWGNPAIIDTDGVILVIFAGYKQHINFVATPSTKQALESELLDYKTGKGSVQLPYNKPLPTQLIEKIALYRVKEYREDGVTWM
jgi:uncharacterized protein YdhG (YjbR/CyaY superfamily)